MPYIHIKDCAMWRGEKCDKDCGPSRGENPRLDSVRDMTPEDHKFYDRLIQLEKNWIAAGMGHGAKKCNNRKDCNHSEWDWYDDKKSFQVCKWCRTSRRIIERNGK